MNRIVVVDEELCTGCGACVELCPKQILFLDETDDVCRMTDETQCDRLRGRERCVQSKQSKFTKIKANKVFEFMSLTRRN